MYMYVSFIIVIKKLMNKLDLINRRQTLQMSWTRVYLETYLETRNHIINCRNEHCSPSYLSLTSWKSCCVHDGYYSRSSIWLELANFAR